MNRQSRRCDAHFDRLILMAIGFTMKYYESGVKSARLDVMETPQNGLSEMLKTVREFKNLKIFHVSFFSPWNSQRPSQKLGNQSISFNIAALLSLGAWK